MVYDFGKERAKRSTPPTPEKKTEALPDAASLSEEKIQEITRLRDELQAATTLPLPQVEVLGLTDNVQVSPSVYSNWVVTLKEETLAQIIERAKRITPSIVQSKPSYSKAVAGVLHNKILGAHARVRDLLGPEAIKVTMEPKESDLELDDTFDYRKLYEFITNADSTHEFDLFDRLFPEMKEGIPEDPSKYPTLYEKRIEKFISGYPVLKTAYRSTDKGVHYRENPTFLQSALGLPEGTGEITQFATAVTVVRQNREPNEVLPKGLDYDEWYPLFEKYCTQENCDALHNTLKSDSYSKRNEVEASLDQVRSGFEQWVSMGIVQGTTNKLIQLKRKGEQNRLFEVLPKSLLMLVVAQMQRNILATVYAAGPEALTEISKKAAAKKTRKKKSAKKAKPKKSTTTSKKTGKKTGASGTTTKKTRAEKPRATSKKV